MKNLYNFVKMNGTSMCNSLRKAIPALGIAAFFTFGASQTQAQTAMSWTGTENDRFTNENNWDPAGSIEGNNLTIPALYDTLGTQLYPNIPVLTGSTSYTVKEITVAFDKNLPNLQGKYIVDLENNDVSLTLDNGGAIQYGSTGIVIKKGHVYFNSYKRLDQVGNYIIVEGGIVEFKRFLIMRDGNNMSTGGHMTISGGVVKMNGGFHDRVNKTKNQITITGDGLLEVAGNYGSIAADIESGWINGGEEFSILRTYDAVANKTTYSAVPASSFLISNPDRQVIVANTSGAALSLIPTKRVTSAKSLTWKYRKQGETTFTAFTDSVNVTSFAPTFTSSGVYYVICEGVDEADQIVKSQEVEFFIGSDAITINPLFDIQYLRPAELGASLTATSTGTMSNVEWKYSTVPSGPYESFATPQTQATFVPSFDSVGNYYVVVEATIDAVKHTSFELFYLVESASTSGKALTWKGLVSNNFKDPANWSPVANTFKNSISVVAFDSTSTAPYPIFETAGNDTISSLFVGAGATMTIKSQDTINVRGSWQQAQGTLNIESGVIVSTGFFRIDRATGVVRLTGNSELHTESLLMADGSNAVNGGSLHLEGNSKLFCKNLPGRIAADSTQSITYISGQAQIFYEGDQRSTVNGWIEGLKIVCPTEGWVPYLLYDIEANKTIVKARNANAFAIANDAKVFTTVNADLSEAITLTNVSGVTSWEWKYSHSINGPWVAFAPAQKDVAEFKPIFTEGGLYYIVAETSTGEITSNLKPIEVIALQIAPAIAQRLPINTNGDTLSYTMPEGVTFVEGIWMILDADGNEINTGVADSIYVPTFAQPGLYQVLYSMQVKDEFGVDYFLQSNAVTFDVYIVGVDNFAASQLKMYPNPSKGVFYVNGGQTDFNVEVISLEGKVLLSRYFTEGGEQAVHFNQKGVYLVKMTAEGSTKVGRLIVK